MREHLQAIEVDARKMMPGEPCHEGACDACVEDRALLDAIAAAMTEAERVDADYRNAAKAFPAVIPFIGADDDGYACSAAMDVLRAYFNPSGDGVSMGNIKCPACDAKGVVPENVYKGHGNYDTEDFTCPLCKGLRTIPDRRAPTANDRAVERIKDAMVGVNCQHCQLFVDTVRRIINEEENRG